MEVQDIIGFEALWDSMMKCKRGVMWKDSVAGFVLDGVHNVTKLSDELENGTYRERSPKFFTIKYPKEREIMSISFRDRVYQRSLNDLAIYPAMSKSFIYDNAACQKGKGADFARNRMTCHMQKFYRKHGADGYILKMDISKYYASMRHDVAKETFKAKLEPEVYERAAKILDTFPGEVGFNPGSQIIQIAGISVPDKIDHYIKERLRVKHYLRYMDDMVVLGESLKELEAIRIEVEKKMNEIGFKLHETKTKITPMKQGVYWLGYLYRLTDTGKVVRTVDPVRVKSARRKYKRLVNKYFNGELPRAKVDESYQCWRNHASKGDGWKMLRNMDNYYQQLWRDADAKNRQKDVPISEGRGDKPPAVRA